MRDKAAVNIVISGAQLVAADDAQGALLLLAGSEVPPQDDLARAALRVFAYVMSGDGAAARFDELRSVTHQLAAEVGADDRQVLLNQEVIGAAQAVEQGDLNRAKVIARYSMFKPIDFAYVAVSLTGQAIAGWVGRERAPGVFAALRRHYGIDDGAA